ncbi:hypothetical protein [Maribellus comscasis]|uniref:hypothetical protein n=1 Tax=Maribellus comscasis TaxID=2681766 RepID=UPI00131A9444|nr:hypothetical protein [Maribellus comscasis]
MKYQIPVLILSLVPLFINHGNEKSGLKVDENCINYILIQGSSNVNQFEFVNYDPEINQPQTPYQNDETYQNIQIPVKEFYGPNNRILNDFFNMVKASEYPYIKIDIEPREKADFDEATGLTNFKTKISIAGNTRNFIIPCAINFCEDSEMVLTGDIELELSDFEIEPPRKLLGTIKVNDEVFVTFAFKYDLKKT